ncbi:MAG TPA: HAMP domain-containing sensor histidine kinase [Roseiarcus sp.]|nr:HAMP domain-containing sensor histidine kinase [Roseiarcus sp.]
MYLAKAAFSARASLARAGAVVSAGAAAALAGALGVAAACAPAAPAHAKWVSGLSLAAALGAVFAARRPRAAADADGEAPSGLASDFVACHRVDGRVTTIEGEGWDGLAADRAELAGYGLIDRVHEDDRARFLVQLNAVAGDGMARAAALRLRRSNGGHGVFEATTAQPGVEGGLVSAFREVRAAPDLACELETAREEARLERSLKDRLLANMSHELRTPLNAILGFSEILGDPALAPVDAEKRFEYARIIHSSADHLLSVVNLVLDMSRIEAGKFAICPEPLELSPLIRECCDMLRLRANRGDVEIVVAPLSEGLEIVADKGACRQIIVNLLSNAVKFTPPRGRVIVEARVEDGVARISVTDTGIGVRPDDLPRLGDPFFQVKSGYDRSFEGAGLGLSLVRGLVGLHDGSLLMESAFGVGTRVTALLPMSIRAAARRVVSARLDTVSELTLPALALSDAAREERRSA